MASQSTTLRSVHDLGLATWFGGSLMGAVGLNKAAATAEDSTERTSIASSGWKAWAPVNAAAIGAYVIGGFGLLGANKGRIGGQKGVGTVTVLKTAATVVALGATAAAGAAGLGIASGDSESTEGTTEPGANTSGTVALAQKYEKVLQWAIPVSTGLLIVLSAKQGEQQRPTAVIEGITDRLRR